MLKRTVLIVEDEPVMRMAIREALTLLDGVETIEAGDGVEALQHIDRYKPDLILLDLLMPRMDGIEVLRILRSSTDRPMPKVVVMSAFLGPNLLEQLQQLGAQRVLTKPFHINEFLKVVEEVSQAP